VHVLERLNPEINIPDDAFVKLFAFFDEFDWHLDDRPLHNDREINPFSRVRFQYQSLPSHACYIHCL
jgi:hypothetical protein